MRKTSLRRELEDLSTQYEDQLRRLQATGDKLQRTLKDTIVSLEDAEGRNQLLDGEIKSLKSRAGGYEHTPNSSRPIVPEELVYAFRILNDFDKHVLTTAGAEIAKVLGVGGETKNKDVPNHLILVKRFLDRASDTSSRFVRHCMTLVPNGVQIDAECVREGPPNPFIEQFGLHSPGAIWLSELWVDYKRRKFTPSVGQIENPAEPEPREGIPESEEMQRTATPDNATSTSNTTGVEEQVPKPRELHNGTGRELAENGEASARDDHLPTSTPSIQRKQDDGQKDTTSKDAEVSAGGCQVKEAEAKNIERFKRHVNNQDRGETQSDANVISSHQAPKAGKHEQHGSANQSMEKEHTITRPPSPFSLKDAMDAERLKTQSEGFSVITAEDAEFFKKELEGFNLRRNAPVRDTRILWQAERNAQREVQRVTQQEAQRAAQRAALESTELPPEHTQSFGDVPDPNTTTPPIRSDTTTMPRSKTLPVTSSVGRQGTNITTASAKRGTEATAATPKPKIQRPSASPAAKEGPSPGPSLGDRCTALFDEYEKKKSSAGAKRRAISPGTNDHKRLKLATPKPNTPPATSPVARQGTNATTASAKTGSKATTATPTSKIQHPSASSAAKEGPPHRLNLKATLSAGFEGLLRHDMQSSAGSECLAVSPTTNEHERPKLATPNANPPAVSVWTPINVPKPPEPATPKPKSPAVKSDGLRPSSAKWPNMPYDEKQTLLFQASVRAERRRATTIKNEKELLDVDFDAMESEGEEADVQQFVRDFALVHSPSPEPPEENQQPTKKKTKKKKNSGKRKDKQTKAAQK